MKSIKRKQNNLNEKTVEKPIPTPKLIIGTTKSGQGEMSIPPIIIDDIIYNKNSWELIIAITGVPITDYINTIEWDEETR